MDEVIRLALLEQPVPNADQAPAEEDASPLSDGDDLEVGTNLRTPGARADVPIAD